MSPPRLPDDFHLQTGFGTERAPRLFQVEARVAGCDRCPRLRAYCRQIAREKKKAFRDQTYWGRPVPAFGDPEARLLIVGLAPAAHGANRTGRMFTSDSSGDWLFRALDEMGVETPTPRPDFAHGARYQVGPHGRELLVSYHPSRQNTNTGVLTRPMWTEVFRTAREIVDG